MKIIEKIVYLLFACCLPVLLVTGTICWEVNELRLYEYGFDKYEISQATGLDSQQLSTVAQHLIDYFDLRTDSAQIEVNKDGTKFSLFNERELIHLEDVRNLIQRDYWVQRGSLLLMAVCALALFFGFKRKWRVTVRGLFWGSVITLGLMIILALWALFGFERFFILFHLISFSNQYWMLDPARDYLIRLFPEGFFYDAALLGYGVVMFEALFIGGIAWGTLRLTARRAQGETKG
ncbi:MAG: TIGR01906 family membrane protein [Dehalococcoidia bacterium]|nr:TIGR01906 family membrane protein [Dehalococcoidia bacterium]